MSSNLNKSAHREVSFEAGIRLLIVQFFSIALGVRWWGFGATASGHAFCASLIVDGCGAAGECDDRIE